MTDPRFANAGAVPFASGFGGQQIPVQHHRSHRNHRPRKSKNGAVGESPLSRDESIHKVDHGHHHFQQSEGVPFGAGYGVPYGVGPTGGFYQQQQQQYTGGNYGFSNQYQGNAYDQGQFSGAAVAPKGKHHRRHHRHHRHQNNEVLAANDQSQGATGQLFGQRSSSALANEAPAQPEGEQGTQNRTHHHAEHSSHGKGHQSRQTQGHTRADADGYGHINEDLIFIERGSQSPHRQQAPPGYEYKGKIEVQGIDKEYRSKSRTQATSNASAARPAPLPQINPPTVSAGPCPPGWQQMVLSAPGGPCPPCGTMYQGQVVGATGVAQTGGMGFGGVGSFGTTASGGGLANLAASLPFPPQGQLVADYIVESGAAGHGGSEQFGGAGGVTGSGVGGATYEEQHTSDQVEEHISGRATIIEVWQKKTRKTEGGETEKPHSPTRSRSRSRSRSHSHSRTRSPKSGPSFDFERFRKEILAAIERIVQSGGSGGKIQWSGHDGGTQTQIHQGSGGYERPTERPKTPTAGSGEVRVIVQPIQPVFYMPRQTETTSSGSAPVVQPIVGPAPVAPQPAASGAPNVIYIPRNVYVPVIKPVFVPRERVIVRPQVIHVARPVLVDRPVPVTQRPIIIDRERPVPVPVRTAQATGQAGGSRTVREEYVYRDNLPVAYGGRCAENAGGVNYGYMPAEQSHQYATSSAQEVSSGYEAQGPVINVAVPNPYQHSQSAAQLSELQNCTTLQGSYANIARTSSASAVNVTTTNVTGRIEVLDPTVNPSWQRTDRSGLATRYGGPAVDIIQKTDQVEQQMYQELRQRSSSGGIQRSHSTASYGSGSGIAANGGGAYATNMSNVNY